MEAIGYETPKRSFFGVFTDTMSGIGNVTIRPVARGVATAAGVVSDAASSVYDSGAQAASKGVKFFKRDKSESVHERSKNESEPVKETKAKHREKEFEAAKNALLIEKFSLKLAAAEKTLMKWKKKCSLLEKKVTEHDEFCNKIIGIFAVGISVANCDGVISEEEKEEIANFAGMAAKFFPETVLKSIYALEESPPSFEDAVRRAKEYGVDKSDVEMVLYITAEADNVITPEEWELLERWEYLSNELWS